MHECQATVREAGILRIVGSVSAVRNCVVDAQRECWVAVAALDAGIYPESREVERIRIELVNLGSDGRKVPTGGQIRRCKYALEQMRCRAAVKKGARAVDRHAP